MVNSDNTIRAGLTSKTIDTDELMQITSFEETTSSIMEPVRGDLGEERYSMPSSVPDRAVELTAITPQDAAAYRSEGGTAQILFGAGDEFVVSSDGVQLRVPARLAAFIPAAVTAVEIETAATVFRARETVAG